MNKIEFAVGEYTLKITFGTVGDTLEVFDKDRTRVQKDADFSTADLEDVVEEYADMGSNSNPEDWKPGLYQNKEDTSNYIMVGGGSALWFGDDDEDPENAADHWSRNEFTKVALSELF